MKWCDSKMKLNPDMYVDLAPIHVYYLKVLSLSGTPSSSRPSFCYCSLLWRSGKSQPNLRSARNYSKIRNIRTGLGRKKNKEWRENTMIRSRYSLTGEINWEVPFFAQEEIALNVGVLLSHFVWGGSKLKYCPNVWTKIKMKRPVVKGVLKENNNENAMLFPADYWSPMKGILNHFPVKYTNLDFKWIKSI